MRGNIDTINLHSWFDCTRCFTVLPVRVKVFLTGRVLNWECCLCIYASMNEFLFVFFCVFNFHIIHFQTNMSSKTSHKKSQENI